MKARRIHNYLIKFALVSVALFFMFGCSWFGGTELSGTAVKGPIDGATVTVYALGADGTRGLEIASTTTGADGSYTVDLGEYDGAVAVVVTGGSYTDEATGETVTLGTGDELETLFASITSGESVAVTALTTIAAARAAENATDGLTTAIANANDAVATAFGLADVDIASVIPSDMTEDATGDMDGQQAYGAVMCGLSQLAESNGLNAEDVLTLISDMASDYEDGVFDGTDAAGDALNTALTITPEAALTGLETAMAAFMNSAENASGLEWTDFDFTIPSIP